MGAIVFPATLPNPSVSGVTPTERRLLSDVTGGPQQARGVQRDYLGVQSVEWTILSAADAASFDSWWKTTLISGGAWFASTWPAPQGWVSVIRRFKGAPAWVHLPGGFWRVTAQVMVRGVGMAPSALLDVACELLLHFDQSDTTLWRDYSINHHALTLTTYGTGSIAATAAGEFGNGLLLTQQYPGDQSTLNYNKHTYIRALGNINLGGAEWFMSASVTLNALPTNTAAVMSNFEGNAGNTYGVLFWINSTGAVAFSVDGAASVTSGPNVITAGTKARIAVSRAPALVYGNPDLLTLFINGVNVGQTTLAFGSSFQTVVQGRTFVGCFDVSTTTGVESLTGSFGGMIDEAYIVKGVGTGVRANYTPPTTEYGY